MVNSRELHLDLPHSTYLVKFICKTRYFGVIFFDCQVTKLAVNGKEFSGILEDKMACDRAEFFSRLKFPEQTLCFLRGK